MFSTGNATNLNQVQWEPLKRPQHASHAGKAAHLEVLPGRLPNHRQVPLIVRFNRILRTMLVAMCGLAILGYGLDVAASNDVGKLQEQARRLTEQNTELSAQLLRVISFQGIQDSVLGRFGLRVPEQVLIVKEVKPGPSAPFKAHEHFLPLMSGY